VGFAVATMLLVAPMAKRMSGAASLASRLVDAGLIAVVAVANLVVYLNWRDIVSFTGAAGPGDLVLGAVLMLAVLEAARRAAGWSIPVCVLLIFAYVFIGPYMPGIWIHPGFPLDYVLEQLYYSSGGVYSSLTGSSATFIGMFILFGALLQVTGGGQTFMDLALLAAGRFRGGPAKVGVLASAMFGMISGSAVANVSVTGNYTIPLMRRLGYDRDFAGGVEAMSSTGGGITPPVIGIAAFIMADFLNIPYLHVIGYAAIPCLLFYVGIIAGVHFEALRSGLAPVPAADLPRARDVLTWSRLVPLLAPVAIMLGLLFNGYSLTKSGFYACASVIVLYLLGLTGVAPKITSVILSTGGSNLVGALAVAAIIPLALGAPLPVTATYILSATLVAPALVRIGLDVVAVHLFMLYWATLASVTPPTCTACVIAANISGGNWFRTALVGMRLGIVAFLMPFFFVVNPALIARGDAVDVVGFALSGIVGALLLAAGFAGWLRGPLNWPLRLVILAAGGMFLAPSHWLLLAGTALALAAIVVQMLAARRDARHPNLL
jgi:TRAP-type uncharacterized transport system fused permease subunit